jgi:hypothetical protein
MGCGLRSGGEGFEQVDGNLVPPSTTCRSPVGNKRITRGARTQGRRHLPHASIAEPFHRPLPGDQQERLKGWGTV